MKGPGEGLEFEITDTYFINGEFVVTGVVIAGEIEPLQIVMLGPDNKGIFRQV